MSDRRPYIINLIGRTGDGKTQFTQYMASLFERNQVDRFQPSNSSESHTQEINSLTFRHPNLGMFSQNDTQGMLTSQGVQTDEVNIAKIINFSKKAGYIHANLIIFKVGNCRLDQATQAALKLFVDCFGVQSLRNTAIVYTNYYNQIERSDLRDHADSVARMYQVQCGLREVPKIPFFTVESCPNNSFYQRFGMTESIKEANLEQIDGLLRWTSTNTPFETADAVVTTYDYRKETTHLKEENNRLEEGQKVVKEWDEENHDLGQEKVTHTEKIQEKTIEEFQRNRKFLGIRLPIMKTDHRVKEEIVGEKTTSQKPIYTRRCQQLGNGTIIYGDWKLKGYGQEQTNFKYYRGG